MKIKMYTFSCFTPVRKHPVAVRSSFPPFDSSTFPVMAALNPVLYC